MAFWRLAVIGNQSIIKCLLLCSPSIAPLLPSVVLCLPQSMTKHDSMTQWHIPLSLQHLLELETLDRDLPLPLVVLAPGDHGDTGQGPGEEEPPPGWVRAHHLQWHSSLLIPDYYSLLFIVQWRIMNGSDTPCYLVSAADWLALAGLGDSLSPVPGPAQYLSIDYIDLRALEPATGPGIAVSCRRGLKHWLSLMTDCHLNGCSHSCEIQTHSETRRHMLHVPIYCCGSTNAPLLLDF